MLFLLDTMHLIITMLILFCLWLQIQVSRYHNFFNVNVSYIYEVYKKNQQKYVHVKIYLIFTSAKPYWEEEPKDVRTTVGGTATFTCKAKGVPKPKIAWFVNGVKLEGTELCSLITNLILLSSMVYTYQRKEWILSTTSTFKFYLNFQ